MKKTTLSLVCTLFFFCALVQGVAAESLLEEQVEELIGTPYKWAGTSTHGFDCSGFTTYVFKQFEIELSRTSASQAKEGTAVTKDKLRAGDLVFFNTNGKSISHVGIYLGDDEFVHSATNKGVMKSKFSESYYVKRYVTARRVLNDDQYQKFVEDQQSVTEEQAEETVDVAEEESEAANTATTTIEDSEEPATVAYEADPSLYLSELIQQDAELLHQKVLRLEELKSSGSSDKLH